MLVSFNPAMSTVKSNNTNAKAKNPAFGMNAHEAQNYVDSTIKKVALNRITREQATEEANKILKTIPDEKSIVYKLINGLATRYTQSAAKVS